jgi:hypothetical protein
MQLADAMMTFTPGQSNPPSQVQVGQPQDAGAGGDGPRYELSDVLDELRYDRLLPSGIDQAVSSLAGISGGSGTGQELAAEASLDADGTQGPQHNWLYSVEPVSAAEESGTARRLGAMVQDLAAFGANSSSSIELRPLEPEIPLKLFAA